jgi:hypothetical protein
MSLAMYASDFNNENMENNPIQKKREIARNKTLKRREPVKSNANIDVLKKRIQYDDGDEDEDEGLSNFQPLQHPNSAGMERIENSNTTLNINGQGTENSMEHGMHERMNAQQNLSYDQNNQTNQEQQQQQQQQQQQEGFTQLPSEYAKQYYQQYVPYFNQGSDDNSPTGVNKDELLTKLNQIIYLLEEQQDEKTGHVTEELILYSFLGIFIIFIVDSFARVGKYVR